MGRTAGDEGNGKEVEGMTKAQIATMLSGTRLPYAYRFFPIGNAPTSPPYILYYYEQSDDFMSDNQNSVNIENLVIELYLTDERAFTQEATIDSTLKTNHITYQKSEEYINETNMYRITYEAEVIINE